MRRPLVALELVDHARQPGAGAMTSSGSMMGTMSWDGGMVAIAILMLASGLIMSRSEGMET
jgi:hypothetical protein